MDRSVRIVPLNIDLSEECFELALSTFLKHLPSAENGADVRRADKNLDPTGFNSVFLAIFFERSTELDLKSMSTSDKTLVSLLEQLDQEEVKPMISEVALVDCGKESFCPLSSFSVLRQKLELISGFVPPQTSAEIFSVDFSGEIDMVAPTNFFATTSERFLRHMGRYVERTLKELNGDFDRSDLPKFRGFEGLDFNNILAKMERDQSAVFQ
jgi:hypothetical protein